VPTKVWLPGEEVGAEDWNNLVQEQVVPTFANAADRDSQITTPHVGQYCHLVDPGVLLQYTDKSVTPGWHKPWDQPWGWVANYSVGPQAFGGTQWLIGGGYRFPVSRRACLVTCSGWAIKEIDGVDAHCVLRMIGEGPTGTLGALRDGLVTLHQGWAGHIQVQELVPTDHYPVVHYQGWTSWGVYTFNWGRVNIVDMGPNPVAPHL